MQKTSNFKTDDRTILIPKCIVADGHTHIAGKQIRVGTVCRNKFFHVVVNKDRAADAKQQVSILFNLLQLGEKPTMRARRNDVPGCEPIRAPGTGSRTKITPMSGGFSRMED